MSTSRLNHKKRLAGNAKIVCTARTVEKFELGFTVWSEQNQCAAADIIPNSTGISVYGVVYEIPNYLLSRDTAEKHGKKSLDAIEGEGNNYIRKNLDLVSSDGSKIKALTYLVRNRREGLKTESHYVQHILNGLREHKIPDDYQQYVIKRIKLNNPEINTDFFENDT